MDYGKELRRELIRGTARWLMRGAVLMTRLAIREAEKAERTGGGEAPADRAARLARMARLAAIVLLIVVVTTAVLTMAAGSAWGQGSRKDDIAFGTNGRPIAGATVTVCASGANGIPCTPLAAIYTDATLTVPSANPFQTDGLGNYHFYALPGRYVVQISGAGINTYTINDTILPNDPSTPTFNSVTATSIALGGNLTVGGTTSLQNVMINGTCTGSGCGGGGGNPGGSLNQMQFNASSTFGGSRTLYDNGSLGIAHKGPQPYIDATAYGALGLNEASTGRTASSTAGSNVLTINAQPSPPLTVGEGVVVQGAGPNGDYLIAGVTAVSGTSITISTTAQTTATGGNIYYDDTYPIQLGINAMCSGGGALNFPPTSGGGYAVRAPSQISVSTATISSFVTTATLATALPSQIANGALAIIANNSDTGVNGTFAITVVDSTHITYSDNAINGTGTGGTISFPAFQVPTTCYDFYLSGGNDSNGTSVQFSRPPKTSISQQGNSLAPPFILTGATHESALTNVVISANNQALQLLSGAFYNLTDVCLNVGYSGNPEGGSADNTPLAIYNTFWVRMRDGCLVVGNGAHATQFAAVSAFVGNLSQSLNLGLEKFEDVVASGGGYLIDARLNGGSNGGGDFIWDNSQIENSAAPFLTITASGSSSMPQIGPVRIFEGASYDCSAGEPFIELNSSSTALGPVWIYYPYECSGSHGSAINVDAGKLDAIHVVASNIETSDSNGNLVGPSIVELPEGIDIVSDNSATQQSTFAGAGAQGASLRFAKSGDINSNMGIDASSGIKMGPGGGSTVCGTTASTVCGGYDSSLVRNSTETTDIEYAAALPVTNLAAAATTGGTLTAGTYYYAVETAGPVSNTYSNYVYTSAAVATPNNAVTVSWTAPGGTNPQGCYIFRSSGTNFTSQAYYYVANCTSTTTFTDVNGTPVGHGTPQNYNQTLAPFYHFAANSAHPSGGTVPYYSGAPASGDCVQWGGSGLLSDAGSGCGGNFAGLGSGTNTSASLTIGSGASLAASGTGTITATAAPFSGISTGTNTAGTMTVGSGASIAVTGTGAVTATKVSPAGTSGDCVKWGTSGALADAGSACSAGVPTVMSYAPAPNGAGSAAAPSATNAINVVKFLVPLNLTFGNLAVDVGTSDSTGGHLYDAGIYNTSGTLLCDWGATALTSGGKTDLACTQGSVTVTPGYYVLAWTGNATTATIYFGTSGAGGWQQFGTATSGTSSSGGALPSTISLPSAGVNVNSTYSNVFILMH